MNKYKFSVWDIVNPNSEMTEFTKLQYLDHIINLSICNLNAHSHKFWSSLAKQDVAFKEISPNGIQSTKFDIKSEIAKYKKQREKIDYISRMKNYNMHDIKTDLPDNYSRNTISEIFETQLEKINKCNIIPYSPFDLNKMCFQDPKQLVPIIEIVKNTPELDKNSRNKIIKFKKKKSRK